ncbi:MAG: SDR family NAD(P)-dependent oxidoreductase [Deltaproteobacteria bacterium]
MLLPSNVVIVTGAGRGIGKAVAKAFAGEGAKVAIVDVDASLAGETSQEMNRLGYVTLPCQADVRSLEDVKQMVATVRRTLGSPTVLVNNAGISQKHMPTLEQDPKEWDQVFDTNLKGTLNCSVTVGRIMVESGAGKIINIASITGFGGFPGRVAYGPSKAAVISLTKTLAVEWAKHGITVNAVAPGYVMTPVIEHRSASGEHDLKMLERRIPLGRLATPEEIADVVLFLASERANYITGIALPVDGGWLAYEDYR